MTASRIRMPLFALAALALGSASFAALAQPAPEAPVSSDSPLSPSSAKTTRSGLSLEEIDLDDPDTPKALQSPSLDPECLSRLPNGGVPGVFPAVAGSMGRCSAMAFAVAHLAPVLQAHRDLWCEDPAGAKRDESARASKFLEGGTSAPLQQALLGDARASRVAALDRREREVCSRWASAGAELSPSVSVFSVGEASLSGARCPAALLEVRLTSGRYAPARNYFIAGMGSCEGAYALPSTPFSRAFVSPDTADALLRRLLSGAAWRGPSPPKAEASYSPFFGLDSLRQSP